MNAEDTRSLETLRRALARKTAVTFAVCTVITLISLIFALVQMTEAKKQQEKTIEYLEKALTFEEQLRLCKLK